MDGWPAHGLVAQIYVEDSDELFKRAIDAGAREIMPIRQLHRFQLSKYWMAKQEIVPLGTVRNSSRS